MYGKFFKNFDFTNCKIIGLEVWRKCFFLKPPQHSYQSLILCFFRDICRPYLIGYIDAKFQKLMSILQKIFQRFPNCPSCPKSSNSGIPFNPENQLEKRLFLHHGGTCLRLMSKFHQHQTQTDFVRIYPRFLAYSERTLSSLGVKEWKSRSFIYLFYFFTFNSIFQHKSFFILSRSIASKKNSTIVGQSYLKLRSSVPKKNPNFECSYLPIYAVKLHEIITTCF
jgi:hypothetical protein